MAQTMLQRVKSKLHHNLKGEFYQAGSNLLQLGFNKIEDPMNTIAAAINMRLPLGSMKIFKRS